MRKAISTNNAPAAIGPYSQALLVGDTLYLSGQIGLDPASGQLVSGGVTAETKQALKNIKAILTAAGFSLTNVVNVHVFLTDISEYAQINDVYKDYFTEPWPARAVVAVAALPGNARVEIAVTAVK